MHHTSVSISNINLMEIHPILELWPWKENFINSRAARICAVDKSSCLSHDLTHHLHIKTELTEHLPLIESRTISFSEPLVLIAAAAVVDCAAAVAAAVVVAAAVPASSSCPFYSGSAVLAAACV